MARYNTKRYNATHYNTDNLFLSLFDSVNSSDLKQDDVYTIYSEFIFPTDEINVLISGQIFSDTIRLSDWLSIKQNPFDQLFGD